MSLLQGLGPGMVVWSVAYVADFLISLFQSIAAASLFLAAKVEEQPRKLEHVVRVAHVLSNRERPQLDPKSDQYMEKAQELVTNENIILQTLGRSGEIRWWCLTLVALTLVSVHLSHEEKNGLVPIMPYIYLSIRKD